MRDNEKTTTTTTTKHATPTYLLQEGRVRLLSHRLTFHYSKNDILLHYFSDFFRTKNKTGYSLPNGPRGVLRLRERRTALDGFFFTRSRKAGEGARDHLGRQKKRPRAYTSGPS